jgi:hypothetical protein
MKKFILFLLALILLFPFQDANAARKRRGGRKTSQHHSSNQKKRRGGKRKSVRKQRGRRRGRGSRDPIININPNVT